MDSLHHPIRAAHRLRAMCEARAVWVALRQDNLLPKLARTEARKIAISHPPANLVAFISENGGLTSARGRRYLIQTQDIFLVLSAFRQGGSSTANWLEHMARGPLAGRSRVDFLSPYRLCIKAANADRGSKANFTLAKCAVGIERHWLHTNGGEFMTVPRERFRALRWARDWLKEVP